MKTKLLKMSIGLMALLMTLGNLANADTAPFTSISDPITTIALDANGDEAAQLKEKVQFLAAMCNALQVALAAAPEKVGYVSPDYKKVTGLEMLTNGSDPSAKLNMAAALAGSKAVELWINAYSFTKPLYAQAIKLAQSAFPSSQAEPMDWFCASVNDAATAAKTTFGW